jgi:hypothetical protein
MFDDGLCAGLPLRRSDAVRPLCGGIACGDDGVAFDYAVGWSVWLRALGEARLPVKRRAMAMRFSMVDSH